MQLRLKAIQATLLLVLIGLLGRCSQSQTRQTFDRTGRATTASPQPGQCWGPCPLSPYRTPPDAFHEPERRGAIDSTGRVTDSSRWPVQPCWTPCSLTSYTVTQDPFHEPARSTIIYREAVKQKITQQQQDPIATPEAAEKSDRLKVSKDPDFILRNFRTMYVDAREARYFDSYQMKAALGRNGDFGKLNIQMVDDPRVADVVFKVSYTFAWDYPFQLRHQNTTTILLAGKGIGPFSGPLGAEDVAREFVNAAKSYREPEKKK